MQLLGGTPGLIWEPGCVRVPPHPLVPPFSEQEPELCVTPPVFPSRCLLVPPPSTLAPTAAGTAQALGMDLREIPSVTRTSCVSENSFDV